MKLHVFPPSPNARKVMTTANHVGADVALVTVDLFAGEQKRPEFLALNPNGRMPVLEYDDGTTLWESNAITNRLASLAGSPIWPKNDSRYDIMRWQFWESAHSAPACAKFIARHFFNNDSIDMAAAEKDFHAVAGVLDGELGKRDWLVGDALTTADISVSAMFAYRDRCQFPMKGYRNIAAWLGRVEALDAWKRANREPEAA